MYFMLNNIMQIGLCRLMVYMPNYALFRLGEIGPELYIML